MTQLRLNLLGAPSFERAGEPISFTQAKGIALVLYLAVTRQAQPRERLIALLWPESLPHAARKNMRNTLWALGEWFGDDLIEQSSGMLRLAASCIVDLHTFEDALLAPEGGALADLEAATELYRGALADGLAVHEAPDFEVWLLNERERVAALYVRLLEQMIVRYRADGAWEHITHAAQRALAVNPTRETAHLALIEASVRRGQRSQAMQQYATLTTTLKRELDVAPLPETVARYHALLEDAALAPTPTPHVSSPAKELPPFVGREQELDVLDHELARAARGEARIVMISGDLGLGKTSLWQNWLATRAAHARVLATHALETAEPIPFGPLLTLFRRTGLAHTIINPPTALAPIWLAELARLLPEIAAAWPNLPPPLTLNPAEERARLLQALTEAMRLMTGQLLVLIIDDLHWADPSTLDWLITLIDQLHDAPLLVIGAYRQQDAAERLKTVLASWQRQGRLRQLPLPHLNSQQSQQLLRLLGVAREPEQIAELARQSGGNPYFITELQRATTNELGCDSAALVRSRLQSTVSPRAMQVLQAAAVLGDEATFAALQSTSGRSEEETLDALDLLDSAGVLTAHGRTFQFVHPLVATIVRTDLRPARGAFLHRRAAEAIERAYAPHIAQIAGRLMEHYALAGDLERAADYADQAAEHAFQIGAFVEATAYARRALAWQPTPRRQLLLAEMLIPTSNASVAQPQLETALHACEQADDQIGVARACLSLALLSLGTGRPDIARKWLARQPLQHIQTLAPELTARALHLAAFVERLSCDYPTAERLLDQAEQLAQQHHLSPLIGQITFERGNLLANRNDLRGALAKFEATLRLAQRSSNPVAAVMALNNLAYHTLLLGEPARAHHYITQAHASSQQYALTFLLQFVASTQGEILLELGEYAAAALAFEQAYTAAHTWGNQAHMANVRANQARLALAQNEWEQARAWLADAQRMFIDSADPILRDKIAQLAAELTAPCLMTG